MSGRRTSIALAMALAIGLIPGLGRAVPPDHVTVGQGAVRNPAGVYKQVTLLATTQPHGETEAPTDGSGYFELDGKRHLLECVRIMPVTDGYELAASTAPNAAGKFLYIVLFDRKVGGDFGLQGAANVDGGGACSTSFSLPFTFVNRKDYRVFGDGFTTRPYPHIGIPGL